MPATGCPSSCRHQCGTASTSSSYGALFAPQLCRNGRLLSSVRGYYRAAQLQGKHRRFVAVFAQRRPGSGPGNDETQYGFEKQGSRWKATINKTEVYITEKDAWQVAVPALVVLGGLAVVIGPLIIGVAVSAIAIGVAFSVGAFALSTFFLPLVFFMLFNFLIFGGIFGGIAVVGLGVFAPGAISAIVGVAGLGLGLAAVNMLRSAAPSAPASSSSAASSAASTPASKRVIEPEDPSEEEMRRMNRELREFDDMMSDREEQKRLDAWRKSRTK